VYILVGHGPRQPSAAAAGRGGGGVPAAVPSLQLPVRISARAGTFVEDGVPPGGPP
jgi:hypothetical protein